MTEIDRRTVVVSIPTLAASLALPAWGAPTGNLQAELDAYRAALLRSRLPDAQLGSPALGRAAGAHYVQALQDLHDTGEALFASPAKCGEDVMRKYAMLEENSARGYRAYKQRTASGTAEYERQFGHWFAQLDRDIERFRVDVNPWWHDDRTQRPLIGGKHLRWRDGEWHEPPAFSDAELRNIAPWFNRSA